MDRKKFQLPRSLRNKNKGNPQSSTDFVNPNGIPRKLLKENYKEETGSGFGLGAEASISGGLPKK